MLINDPEIVVAVDINPNQLKLIELKRAGFKALDYESFIEFLGFRESTNRIELFKRVSKFLSKEDATYWKQKATEIELGIINQGKFEKYFQSFSKKVLPKIHSKKKIDAYVEKAFKKSIFSNKERYEAFAKDFSLKTLQKDPLYVLVDEMINKYETISGTDEVKGAEDKLEKANRLFVDGIRKMNPDKSYYPNANSTLRLTYGKVGPYKARDAVSYDYYTTIEGIMQKENPAKDDPNNEFVVEDKLKELYEKKDYGRYAENGELIVNFITNNDITGGNSGSPVINAKGELIGCAFDGNWEAMSGDISFENKVQRTISVDIRYTLFIIDKYAGAKHIIDEMTLIK